MVALDISPGKKGFNTMSNTFDPQELLGLMVSTAQDIAQGNWNTIQETAETEFEMMLARVEKIKRLRAADRLTEDEAKFIMSLEVSRSQLVLIRLKVLENLEIQRMINAVLNVIGSIVNKAVGFKLIEIED